MIPTLQELRARHEAEERAYVVRVVVECGSLGEAARVLGVSRYALNRRLDALQVDRRALRALIGAPVLVTGERVSRPTREQVERAHIATRRTP